LATERLRATRIALLITALAVLATGALGISAPIITTTAAHAEDITLCWAAWDPANALVAGENPFPDGYRRLPPDRIVHVHAKDCHVQGYTPEWGPLGTLAIDWKGQISALRHDGYQGHVSLETHWPGPRGNKLEASRICGWNLRGLTSLEHDPPKSHR